MLGVERESHLCSLDSSLQLLEILSVPCVPDRNPEARQELLFSIRHLHAKGPVVPIVVPLDFLPLQLLQVATLSCSGRTLCESRDSVVSSLGHIRDKSRIIRRSQFPNSSGYRLGVLSTCIRLPWCGAEPPVDRMTDRLCQPRPSLDEDRCEARGCHHLHFERQGSFCSSKGQWESSQNQAI
jgi:hypothetical protein